MATVDCLDAFWLFALYCINTDGTNLSKQSLFPVEHLQRVALPIKREEGNIYVIVHRKNKQEN